MHHPRFKPSNAAARSLVDLQAHGFGVNQYVCQRDLVTIGNEPATPTICELPAPTGLSEPEDAGKDNSSNES